MNLEKLTFIIGYGMAGTVWILVFLWLLYNAFPLAILLALATGVFGLSGLGRGR